MSCDEEPDAPLHGQCALEIASLRAEVKQLRIALSMERQCFAEFRVEMEGDTCAHPQCQIERDALRVENAVLKVEVALTLEALFEYGDHREHCRRFKRLAHDAICDCGYSEALGNNTDGSANAGGGGK